MSAADRFMRFCLLYVLAAAVTALPFFGFAQTVPASSRTAAKMDKGTMTGVDHPGMISPESASPVATGDHKHRIGRKSAAPMEPASQMPDMSSGSMSSRSTLAEEATTAAAPKRVPDAALAPNKDRDHAAGPATPRATMAGMAEGSPPMQGSMAGLNMDAMQGGVAPPDARSSDYSDGVGYGLMKPHMQSNRAVGMLLLDQLETIHGRSGNGQAWEVEGWYGHDRDKLWLRSEGEVSEGTVEDGNVEALWNHAIAIYWGGQLGLRHDFGAGPGRDWIAFGVQGLSPYWFELEATGYVGSSGRTAGRFRADYEVLFTQRLILQPELEFNLYGEDDPSRRTGSGLSDVNFGLRLRYEIRREFAPYAGINWVRRTGTTADYARVDGQPVFDQQFVAGFRIWF